MQSSELADFKREFRIQSYSANEWLACLVDQAEYDPAPFDFALGVWRDDSPVGHVLCTLNENGAIEFVEARPVDNAAQVELEVGFVVLLEWCFKQYRKIVIVPGPKTAGLFGISKRLGLSFQPEDRVKPKMNLRLSALTNQSQAH